jgi:anti-sigma regulatory factor (Ser/Thr protein kinase)/CheY-like chemotaxis protein
MQGNRSFSVLAIGDSEQLNEVLADNPGPVRLRIRRIPDMQAGIARLEAGCFDVVIAEVNGPDEEDVKNLEAIRRACRTARVILLAAESTSQKIIEAMRHHAFSYFSRPFDVITVREMISQAALLSEWADAIQMDSASPNFLTFRLRCTLPTAERLVQFLREMPLELPERDREEMTIAMKELLFNAIEHGGGLDQEKWVRISRIRTSRAVVYHIQDPGEGFRHLSLEHAAVSNPNDPAAAAVKRAEAGMRPGGFGMLLATKLVDEVLYNQSGNEVILIKRFDQ